MTSNTPGWLPLTVAAIGVAGTLSASIFTQIWTSRREDVRWKREGEQLARQLNYSERRSLYADVLSSFALWRDAMFVAWKAKGTSEAADEAERQFMVAFTRLCVLAPPQVVLLTSKLAAAGLQPLLELRSGRLVENPDRFGLELAYRTLLNEMRRDLGLGDEEVGMALSEKEPIGFTR